MKKIYAILFGILFVLLIVGCKKTVVTEDGSVVTTTQTGNKVNYEATTKEGTVTGTQTSEEWCAAGSNWNYAANTGDQSATWKIVGYGTGKYTGLCHVLYTAQSAEGATTMDYYFSQDGKSGYYEIKMPNGQIYSQQFNNP